MAPHTTIVTARTLGPVNWLGLWTLYLKEVRRFMKVWTQTLLAPLVTALLFYAVFALALGGQGRVVGDTPFLVFLGPGLIMMSILQNAFANTSSSIVISKVQGNIVDVLMPPLSPLELAFGMMMGGVTRGLLVGLVTSAVIWIFVPLGLHSPGFVLFHALMASMMLSLLGLIGGIWSEKFDHIAAITNFIVTPLSFLSGTFYTAESLPTAWRFTVHLNPFFYLIDGFRYGFIGQTDGTLWTGVAVVMSVNAALWLLAWHMISKGYKLKA